MYCSIEKEDISIFYILRTVWFKCFNFLKRFAQWIWKMHVNENGKNGYIMHKWIQCVKINIHERVYHTCKNFSIWNISNNEHVKTSIALWKNQVVQVNRNCWLVSIQWGGSCIIWWSLWWVFHSNKNAVSDIRLNVVGDLKKLYKSLYMRQSP